MKERTGQRGNAMQKLEQYKQMCERKSEKERGEKGDRNRIESRMKGIRLVERQKGILRKKKERQTKREKDSGRRERGGEGKRERERELSIRLELLASRPDLSSPFLSPPTLLEHPLYLVSTLAHHGTTTHLSSPPTNHTTQ